MFRLLGIPYSVPRYELKYNQPGLLATLKRMYRELAPDTVGVKL
jgi:hypothetical protein